MKKSHAKPGMSLPRTVRLFSARYCSTSMSYNNPNRVCIFNADQMETMAIWLSHQKNKTQLMSRNQMYLATNWLCRQPPVKLRKTAAQRVSPHFAVYIVQYLTKGRTKIQHPFHRWLNELPSDTYPLNFSPNLAGHLAEAAPNTQKAKALKLPLQNIAFSPSGSSCLPPWAPRWIGYQLPRSQRPAAFEWQLLVLSIHYHRSLPPQKKKWKVSKFQASTGNQTIENTAIFCQKLAFLAAKAEQPLLSRRSRNHKGHKDQWSF